MKALVHWSLLVMRAWDRRGRRYWRHEKLSMRMIPLRWLAGKLLQSRERRVESEEDGGEGR